MPISEGSQKCLWEIRWLFREILDKGIHIHQRPLASQSKALSHVPQRELYTMANSILIRWETERSHLKPNLRESRHQQLRSSPFSPTPLSNSKLVKDGEECLLKKPSPKHSKRQALPNSALFVVPTTTKKRLLQEASLWGTIYPKQ